MNIDYDKLKEIVLQNNSFLLTTHVNPDADAIGSELAIARSLKRLGKEVRIINNDSTPENLIFLLHEDSVEVYRQGEHDDFIRSCDVLAAVDFNQYDRMVDVENVFRESTGLKICIDHHRNPDPTFNFIFDDIEYSATGEILFDFLITSGLAEVDFEIAEPLYAAIMTDTGSFRFERTCERTHRIAAELLKTGVDPTLTYDKLYNRGSVKKISLLGEALESVKVSEDGKIAYMVVTREMFERTGTVRADLEGFVNYCLTIGGVIVGFLATELEDGVKVSFRSKENFDVSSLAAEFGGGGHLNASGAKFTGKQTDEVIEAVLRAAEEKFNSEKS